MWCFIKVRDEANSCRNYIVKTACSQKTYTIFVCNIMHGWLEIITLESLLARCQKLNPLLEASPDSLVAHVMSLLDGGRSDVERCLAPGGGARVLRLQSKLVGVPFLFEFHLEQAAVDQMYVHVTTPILLALLELHERQNCLIKLLKRKDAEIDEYKINGGQLSRRSLETPVFDEHEFVRTCLESPFAADLVSDPRERLFTPTMQNLFTDMLLKMDRCAARDAGTEDNSVANGESSTVKEEVEPSATQGIGTVATAANTVSSVANGETGDVSAASPVKTEVKTEDGGSCNAPLCCEAATVTPPKKKKYNQIKLGL